MQITRIAIAAAACALFSAAAHASPELAASKACMACHSVDKKLVGPAFKDVAAKYKGSKDSAAQLSGSILKGSSGKWGPVPMPANRVTDAEADTLAKWVLTL
ncbi:cytochrome C [Cupriavidus sp. UYMMa02A]|nr:cytochrome C [Cupriavidus sp. UYMMa02A]